MITSPTADSGAEIARLDAVAADFRRRLELDPDVVYPAHAECLWHLGNLRFTAGETEAGLLAVSEALALYKALAQAQPDPYGLQLASMLTTQSNLLAEASHLEEALAVGNDAVETALHALEAVPQPGRLPLVSALVNMAGLKMRAGDTAATVEKLTQAVDEFRRGDEPGSSLQGSMVEALHHAAMAFTELGLWPEAIGTRRLLLSLFGDEPPAGATQLLALTLQQASVSLVASGQAQQALAHAAEAADLVRELAKDEEGGIALRLALAQVVGNLAVRCHDAGRSQEGLALALEAVDLFQDAVVAEPLHAVPSLILTLDGLVAILEALDLPDQAATVREQRSQLQQTLDIITPHAG